MPAPRTPIGAARRGSARYWQLGTPVHGWVKPQKRVKRLCTFSCRLPAVGRNRALVRGVLCYSMRSPARRLARAAPSSGNILPIWHRSWSCKLHLPLPRLCLPRNV